METVSRRHLNKDTLLSQWLLLTALLGFVILRSFYRLYFHPLAKIPGPRLAAITSLYEFWWDVIQDGRFTMHIGELHKQYGPIVRINPHEVHIIDPSFYHEIYAPSARRRDKALSVVTTYGVPYSMVSTVQHDLHRYRRGLLNDFFSKRSVLSQAPIIEERVLKMLSRLEEFHNDQNVLDICSLFGALTSDIITFYCYGKSWGFLEEPDFRSDIRIATNDFANWSHVNRFFPILNGIMRMVPPQVMGLLMPGKSALFEFQRSIYQHFSAVIAGKTITVTGDHNIVKRLTDEKIPPKERTLARLQDEGFTLLIAGTETTMRALSFTAYYVFQDANIRDKLRAELKQVLPTPTSTTTWPVLEKLPYLNGVINEALRLSHAAIIRLPRVAPDETLQYKNYVIPPGTPMSTSIYYVHCNPDIFPDPTKFDPERWIRAAETGEPLHKYLVPFTKGSRICLGMNLAFIEMYLAIAYFVRRFDFEILDKDPANIKVVREKVVGFPEKGRVQIRAKVTGMVRE